MTLSWDGTILLIKKKKIRKGMIFKKLNGIELGWKCFAYQAKKIRKGMIQQKKNGIELE
jgi:hypothetical protein